MLWKQESFVVLCALRIEFFRILLELLADEPSGRCGVGDLEEPLVADREFLRTEFLGKQVEYLLVLLAVQTRFDGHMLAVRVHEPDDERPRWYLALRDAIHNVSPIDGSLGFVVERNRAFN